MTYLYSPIGTGAGGDSNALFAAAAGSILDHLERLLDA